MSVSSGGAPASGVQVALSATRTVFTTAPNQPPTMTSATATTDTTGQATFQFNPPNPQTFDETDFTATGSVNGATFSCSASMVVGIGTLSAALDRYLSNGTVQAALQPFETHLFAFRKALLANPASINILRASAR